MNNEFEIAANFIKDKILSTLEQKGERYIFRGESHKYDKPVSSGLYRHVLRRTTKEILEYDIASILDDEEKRIIEKARQHFANGTDIIEIFAEIQHYGGITRLIDFTYDLHIALFFASFRKKLILVIYIYIETINSCSKTIINTTKLNKRIRIP